MIHCADLFCGAGGTSTGLVNACLELDKRIDLLAVNHWTLAIQTHQTNYPWARHLCESLDSVEPRKVVPTGKLDLLVASPECTHHSNARGGKPCSDQSRASAWHILRWAEALRIESILIENVKEFSTWGPLGTNGRPLKTKKGQTFRGFIHALESLNYSVSYRVLNAANYGDPTTRERLFVMARRGGKAIRWPDPSHGPKEETDMLCHRQPWRAAKEIIDWSIPGKSIFKRKKSLAPTTMARITAGLRKFCGESAEPFIIAIDHQSGSGAIRDVGSPLSTTTTKERHALVQPFITAYHCGVNRRPERNHTIEKPLPTLDTSNRFALVQPFVIGQQSGAAPRSTDDPLPTVATSGAISLIQPFLVKYYGTGNAKPVSEPIDTITAKDRFGLVQVDGMLLDIHFRMLQPHELARAMSFPDSYQFAGNREAKVKQIGNAVPVRLATALCKSLLS